MSTNIKKTPYEFKPDVRYPLYLIRRNLFQAINKYAPQLSGKLMDFGCGLKPYEFLFNVKEYIGVDYKGEGETYPQDKVDVFYDGKILPFPDNHFDSIFSSEVFEHIFNLPEIMDELYRVLKPGGKILITCPFSFAEHEIPADYARYTSFGLKDIFLKKGFQIITYEKTGSYIDAICQLRIVYWDKHILSRLQKIPVIRSISRIFIFSLNNIGAIILRKILPYRQDLYLNNILLAQKA